MSSVELAALEFGVVAAEHLLGEFEHAGKIGFGQAQQRQDDVERIIDRDLLDEVALGPLSRILST